MLFSFSVQASAVSSHLKKASVTPVFKSLDKESVSN